ncbi:MAG: DUF3822 family protein [Saprospiraceae bacterium]
MEINIPFSTDTISSDQRSEDIKYRAILSRGSLFYGLFDSNDKISHHGNISIDEIPKSSFLKKNTHSFIAATIAFNNNIFNFIPQNNVNNIDPFSCLFFSQSIFDKKKYEVLNSKNIRHELTLSFAVPKIIIKSINHHVSNCNYLHYQSAFIDSIENKKSMQTIAISIVSGIMNIALIQNGTLVLSNNYKVRNESDFYYYIALLFTQYELLKGQIHFILDGDFSEVKLDRIRFKNYFGNFPEMKNTTTYSHETNTHLLPLIHLNRCASLEAN